MGSLNQRTKTNLFFISTWHVFKIKGIGKGEEIRKTKKKIKIKKLKRGNFEERKNL